MRFQMHFREVDMRLPIRFDSNNNGFNAVFKGLQTATARAEVEYYDGEYDVTPKVEAQSLPTKQKFLNDDVRIKEIPRYDVSNNSGGTTVYIAFMEEETRAVLGKGVLGKMKL